SECGDSSPFLELGITNASRNPHLEPHREPHHEQHPAHHHEQHHAHNRNSHYFFESIFAAAQRYGWQWVARNRFLGALESRASFVLLGPGLTHTARPTPRTGRCLGW